MNPLFQRLVNVAEAIEREPSLASDLQALSDVAALSPFHLHRLFASHFNQNIGAYGRKVRVYRAAYQLAFRNDIPILTVALDAGFSSAEGFARAFKKLFDVAPSTFRAQPQWELLHQRFTPLSSLTVHRGNPMNNPPFSAQQVNVQHFPTIPIAEWVHQGQPNLVLKTVKSFIEWRKQETLPPSAYRTFNVLYDDPNTTRDEDYRFGVACEIPQEKTIDHSNIETKHIPAGLCATVRLIGDDSQIGDYVHELYASWLPSTLFVLRDFPIFIERVRFYPEVGAADAITDIYLPIEEAQSK
tara:strand:+ start:13632 stop:14528 length:897 start_codon:yes stop_codon:yes gene_type:complete